MTVPALRSIFRAAAAATLATLALTGAAQAHITLEQRTAPAGSTYKAVFRVGHGCAGSATRAVVVYLPAGVTHAHPMPKPGWALDALPASGEATQIAWRGGPLLDAHYDEFVLRAQLPAQPGPLWWRVQQVCENGEVDWAKVPATGTDTHGLATPAALLQVLPAANAAAAGAAPTAPSPADAAAPAGHAGHAGHAH